MHRIRLPLLGVTWTLFLLPLYNIFVYTFYFYNISKRYISIYSIPKP